MGKRGRPKGSVNRPREVIDAEKVEKAQHPNRGRGRPKGSLNKPKTVNAALAKCVKGGKDVTGTHNRKYGNYNAEIKSHGGNAMANPQTAEEKTFNARLIDHIMGIHEIATHADKHDLMSLKSCFVAYLQLCQKNGFSVLNMAAYSAMGMSKDDFTNMCKKDDPDVREFCKMVRDTCGMFRESLVEAGKLNPVIGIFWQRNYDGLRNDTEQIQNALEQDDTYVNGSKAYKEKYKNLLSE